jgi:hypothetical protein
MECYVGRIILLRPVILPEHAGRLQLMNALA